MKVLKGIANVFGVLLALVLSLVLFVMLITAPVISAAGSFTETDTLKKVVKNIDYKELLAGMDMEEAMGESGLDPELIATVMESGMMDDLVEVYADGIFDLLEGKVDIYLPDLKYSEARLAKSLSGAADYFPRAKSAIREMVRQTGPVQWDGDKIVKGVIIRHLILPGHVDNSLKVLDWIGENFHPGEVLVSLMSQYTPMPGMTAPLNRRVTKEEYDAVLSWMLLNDLEGFTQEISAADDGFIPDFQQK